MGSITRRLIVELGAAALLMGCGTELVEVDYRVDGPAGKQIPVSWRDRDVVYSGEVTLPWIKDATVPRGQLFVVTAQNRDGIGTISCSITLDDDTTPLVSATDQQRVECQAPAP
jgi:hypothetical protein